MNEVQSAEGCESLVKLKQKRMLIVLVGITVILLAIVLPRIMALDRFVTPDENNWLFRSANFYFALGQRDFASTYQKEHPGVTTMWAGVAGFLVRYPEYRASGMGQLIRPLKLDRYLRRVAQIQPLEILVASRYFIVLGNALVLILGFFYAQRLIGTPAAILGLLLIAFDPFHIALTRILHTDGSLSSLLFLSILAFISYLHRRNILDLIISGVAAGLGCLTKSPGFIIIPTVGLITLLDFARTFSTHEEISHSQRIWGYLWPLMVWGLVALLFFVLLWPAMWVAPQQTLTSVLSQAQEYAEKGHKTPIFFNGTISESGDLGIEFFYFYPLTYLWRSTPVVLIGLLGAIVGYIKKREPLDRSETRTTVFGLLIFVLIFTIVMTLGTKKFDRYLLPVYAPLDIIAAIGWVTLAHWLAEKAHHSA
ncbi:MAG: glycosyltransferase family 39 protein, partial [bacterium]